MFMTALCCVLPLVAGGQPCADCHTEQHQAWATSRHANSAASPLYLAMREWARSDGGEEVAARCTVCHTVALAGGGRSTAVDCGACHQARRGDGAGELLVDPVGAVQASRPAAEAPHAVSVTPDFARDAACQPCHAELVNPAGVPLCTTGPEAAARHSGVACTACHTPHAFPATAAEVAGRAATVSLQRRGEQLTVAVIARGVGHALPTGAALRQVRLVVEFLDARGKPLADNRNDPKALFARLLADEAGKVPAPPWRARAVARDSRLAAGERRLLTYPIPAQARAVTAHLVYHRAPEALLARLGLAAQPALTPQILARAYLDLSAPD